MTETVTVKIPLPWDKPPLTANMRPHHMERARIVASIRWTVLAAARRMNLPKGLEHITIGLHYIPPDRRRRDEDNLVPTLKAACDALAAGTKKHPGYGMTADDTPQEMTKLMPIIEAPDKTTPPHHRLWLAITWEELA